jgi:V8-like Glu-specific endopeptidase
MKAGRTLIGLSCVVGMLVPAAAQGSPVHHDPGAGKAAHEYWTPARMAAAEPVEFRGRIESPERLRLAGGGYTSEAVLFPAADPYPAVGKVFFRLGGSNYFCSAAIVNSPGGRVVWTAAHCVRDPGPNGKWAGKWTFVPGYEDGFRPYGSWSATDLWIDRSWFRSNDNGDFAAALIRRRNGDTVQDAVGVALPFGAKPRRNQEWEAIGYPADARFDNLLWHCVSDFHGTDRSGGNKAGPEPFGIGCDMAGGSSGGPWITQAGKLGAVTSYGYTNRPNSLYGTYLGGWAAKLFRKVKNR